MARPSFRFLSLALALVVPVALSSLACPKNKSEATDDAGGDASSSVSAASATESGPAWSTAPSTSYGEEDASLGADPLDLDEETDAVSLENSVAFDAKDAHDAKKHLDAADDAPLLGTKVYADEEPQSGFRYVTSDAAKVHKAPKDGKAFVSLPRGTQVWLLGRSFDWYRIKFEDPSIGALRQGWIYYLNVVGPRLKTCPEGWMHHDDDRGWCERECTKNADCKGLVGWKCSGTGCFYAVQP